MTEPRRRLFLINPRPRYYHHTNHRELAELFGKHKMSFPLALPTLAALVPPAWEVRILDDESGPLPDERPDLAGITAMASNADRAYEIADRYRAQGVPVVMGGSYVTFMEEEALGHADHLVLGEAEGAWETFLADFEAGRARRSYRQEQPVDFRRRPAPRWDLVDTRHLMAVTVETSRGCPFQCDFCIVHKMYGRRLRYRDVDDVVAELRGLPMRMVLFADDNFPANRPRTRELVAAMKPLGLTWMCQADVQVAEDEDLLRRMADAGLSQMLIGFDSLDPGSLEDIGKTHNRIEKYEEAIRRIHGAGIQIIASFMVGFDHDTLGTFDRIAEFVERNRLLFSMLSLVAVLPGTELYERYGRQGRRFPVSTALRNGVFPNVHYQRMGQLEMFDRYFATLRRLFDCGRVLPRAAELLGGGAFARPNGVDVSFGEKASAFLTLLRRFQFSRNPAKRRLFSTLFRLGRSKVASMDQVVFLLMAVQAQEDYLRNAAEWLDGVRDEVKRNDRGPWERLAEAQPQPSQQ